MSGYPIMRHFRGEHHPQKLQEVADGFELLAEKLIAELPRNAETSAALRKLLEAKDCAIRSMVEKLSPEK